jgi:acyl-CoA dehydrogenase
VHSFVSSAYGKNNFTLDSSLLSILEYYGIDDNFRSLGKYAGKELYQLTDYVDKIAHPKLIMWDIDGRRVDKVWLDPLEIECLETLIRKFRVNMLPYEKKGWLKHYTSIYLIADPGIACIITVTNQTAFAVYKYGDKRLRKSFDNLVGRRMPLKYGATWFTEVQGGSDLGSNRTMAKKEGGFWRLNGEKYFASNAGIADYALVTARPESAPKGVRGLGLFFVPRYNSREELNFFITRLKEKSATIAVPTGEVQLNDTEAYSVGEVEKGIYYTMENLMVSRLANSFGAAGIARKAFFEAFFYSKKREAFGKKLIEHPLIIRDLIDMEIAVTGALAISFKAAEYFQRCWNEKPPYSDVYNYARLLTHIAKNLTAETASFVTSIAMELHGGRGFLREYPIERLHREALITPIWEGTSNIQALDLIEVISKKNAHVNLLNELEEKATAIGKKGEQAVSSMREDIERMKDLSPRQVQFGSKDFLNKLGRLIASFILVSTGKDIGDKRLARIGELYYIRYVEQSSYPFSLVDEANGLLNNG